MKKKLSIGSELYIFFIVTVLGVAIGTSFLAYRINSAQIDKYYKQVAYDSAKNFSALVDGDYLSRLRAAAETDEFQEIREAAEENDDEGPVREYLEKNGLWDQYVDARESLNRYLRNMEAIRYLYIVAVGDSDAKYDMYLLDDDENPIYETGYYEEREEEFEGFDGTTAIEPTISTGDWGWLCSAYAPVYDSQGNVVCTVGCDIGMDDVMAERHKALLYVVGAAVLLTVIVLFGAVILIRRNIIKPINSLTAEMKKFKPFVNAGYEEAGVADLELRRQDEIHELYDGIRSMQVNIVDYLNDMDALQKDKERAEEDIKDRDEKIGQISREVYRDTLTGVGNKAAYIRKVDELNKELAEGRAAGSAEMSLAIVMVDLNDLKRVNDDFGHNKGDQYINGCCKKICETFKHSPVFRIGGDEFVVILQGVDYGRRHASVAQLKNDFAASSCEETANPWERYSAAVGMAEMTPGERNIELIFRLADKAMYEDKEKYKKAHGSYR